MADLDVAAMSSSEKLAESLRRSLPHLGPGLREEVAKLLSPEALVVMVAVISAWVAAHFIGVGEAVDIILCVVGAFTIGLAVFDGVEEVWEFADGAFSARSSWDLDEAGKHFAKAVSILGVQAVLAILFKNRPRSYKGTAVELGAPPSAAGSFMVPKPGLTSTRSRSAGFGYTTAWGEIVISRLGSRADRRLAALHESVHRLLTPRLILLRSFRIRNRTTSYERSAFSKFLEEAVAETVAQVSVNGFRSVFRGISFPVAERYVSLLRTDGNLRPFLPEVGGLVAGGFLMGGMAFEIWDTPRPPQELPSRE